MNRIIYRDWQGKIRAKFLDDGEIIPFIPLEDTLDFKECTLGETIREHMRRFFDTFSKGENR